MAYPNNPQLNLASILQTLSNGAQAGAQPHEASINAQYASTAYAPAMPPTAMAPGTQSSHTQYQGFQPSAPDPYARQPISRPDPVPPPPEPAHNRPSSTPPVDPRSIVSWPPALRYVTKLMGQNEAAASRIRHMIESQHKHEWEWHRGREKLIEVQSTRKDAEEKVADVLRSIGGVVGPSKGNVSPEEHREELQRYDAKVHRACRDMQNSMTAELEGLRIPFFCVRPELVRTTAESTANATEDGPDQKERLPPDQLKALKMRVIELLEDMCKD